MRSSELLPRFRPGYRFVLIVMVATLGAVVLFRYPPTVYTFYPQCPVWAFLHIRCPGCGSTRALAALLHGRFAEALRWNALTVCALPVLLAGEVARRMRLAGDLPARALPPPRTAIYAALGLVTTFGVLRNL